MEGATYVPPSGRKTTEHSLEGRQMAQWMKKLRAMAFDDSKNTLLLPFSANKPASPSAAPNMAAPQVAAGQIHTKVSNSLISSATALPSVKPRPGLSSEVGHLVAVTSSEYERSRRNVRSERYYWKEFVIDPLERDFSRPEPGNGWKSYIHPEGALYFQNASLSIPVITDVYVYEDLARERLERYIQQIFSYIRRYGLTLPLSDICLVLEFRLSGECGYYFVDHAAQCLFWLDDFDAASSLRYVRIKYTPSLIGHEMKSLYWLHNSYYPHLRAVSDSNIVELKEILIHAIGDTLTSSSTTVPFELGTLEKMLALVKEIKADKSGQSESAAVIYRLLQHFHSERYLILYGEQGARLNAHQSIHHERRKSLLITILSPLLLYGPEVHLRHLKETSVDALVTQRRWNTMLQRLINEWKEFTLYATVLLNANVAFLAIQSVDGSATPLQGHSSMQRASYFSIMSSVGAILLGMLLVWQHSGRMLTRTSLAHRSNYNAGIGLESLALLYSLPYSLLMWGFVSFLAAFLFLCFHAFDVLTVVMIACSGVALLSFLFWTVSLTFETKPSEYGGILRYFVKQDGILACVGRLRE